MKRGVAGAAIFLGSNLPRVHVSLLGGRASQPASCCRVESTRTDGNSTRHAGAYMSESISTNRFDPTPPGSCKRRYRRDFWLVPVRMIQLDASSAPLSHFRSFVPWFFICAFPALAAKVNLECGGAYPLVRGFAFLGLSSEVDDAMPVSNYSFTTNNSLSIHYLSFPGARIIPKTLGPQRGYTQK